MILSELAWGLVGFLLTVMILSYLIGDNFFFRLAAHVFIGLTAAYVLVLIIYQIMGPYLVHPLVQGTWTQRLWMMIPLILISLLLISQFPRFSRLGRIPWAFLLGITAALTVGGSVFGTLVPQFSAVVAAFDLQDWFAVPDQTWLRVVEASVMLIGVITTLSTFHFGRKRKIEDGEGETQRPAIFEGMSKVGQVFIGVTLGAIFSSIFSSSLLALIDRLVSISQLVGNLFGGS
jgi:CBS domain containing-hemolysin-like protein